MGNHSDHTYAPAKVDLFDGAYEAAIQTKKAQKSGPMTETACRLETSEA